MKQQFLLLIFLLALTGIRTANAQHWEAHEIAGLPDNYGIWGISVVDENVVWGVARNVVSVSPPVPSNHLIRVVKTTDGGETWNLYEVEEAIGRISYDITAFDENTAFITTQDLGSGAGRGVFKTTDGGLTWTEIYNHHSAGVWLRFFDENEAIVVNRHRISKTYDGGDTWTLLDENDVPPFASNEFNLLGNGTNNCIQMGNRIWAPTNKGRVYYSHDRGETWEARNVGLGDEAVIYSLAFLDTLRGFAMTIDWWGIEPSTLSYTDDGGDTWTPLANDTEHPYTTIAYIPGADNAIIAAGDAYTVDYTVGYSLDICASWAMTEDYLPIGPIQFISPTVGWAARNGPVSMTGVTAAMFKYTGDLFDAPSRTYEPAPLIGLSVYPNPFSTQLELTVDAGATLLSVEIFSLDGRQAQRFPAGRLLNTGELPAGVYILKAFTDKGVGVEKIVKF